MSKENQLAVLQPPRLPLPEGLKDRYGIDPDQWGVLVDATFPSAATTQGVLMALAYCKQRNLDIFRKPIHIVPMSTKDANGEKRLIETIWPGIGETRITAHRQSDFAGYDACEFGEMIRFNGQAKVQKWTEGKKNGWDTVKWQGMVPEWAQFTVYKIMHGQRIALPGPRVYFMETYAQVSGYNPAPNERWTRAPRQMLEKCAEAAALRRAWPDVFGDEATFDEMEGREMRYAQADSAPEQAAAENMQQGEQKARPKRSDFQKSRTKAEDIQDAVFEEVTDNKDHKPSAENAEPSKKESEASEAAQTALPQTRVQWEIWQDQFVDRLDSIQNPVELQEWINVNIQKLESSPEDIGKSLSAIVSALRQRLSERAGGAGGSAEGQSSTPQE